MLFLFFALVIGIPAWCQLPRRQHIHHHSGSAVGYVSTVRNALGWLWTSAFGNVTRPTIKYEPPSRREMSIEIATSSMFTFRRYEPGMPVEVIYDSTSPWDAYARPEWDENQRDLRIGLGSLALAVIMYVAGRIQAM